MVSAPSERVSSLTRMVMVRVSPAEEPVGNVTMLLEGL